ncbi:MAG TPA: R3H domain-containing nucleic acid-binding protein [Thermoanaerobaculia bacterium]|nr:R3H domain-containing nucleic acid-binding protein [Thermoanaerobaculia bacterium]
MSQRFEGKNVDEAIDTAASALGVDRAVVDYSVVVEKRGFLGGTKRIVIEAKIRDTASTEIDGPSNASALSVETAAREQPAEPRASSRSRRREAPSRVIDETPQEPSAPLSENGAALDRWCRELFEKASLTLRARVTESEETFNVVLSGVDAPLLIDKGGELLDSIQVLTNKTAFARNSGKRIEFDCSSFKEKRSLELGEQAHSMAEKVRGDGSERLLPAMGPAERRIIHLALQDDTDVETESRGEGFFKRVAVIPRKSRATEPAES